MRRVLNVKHYQDPYLRTVTVEGFPGGSVVKNLLAHAEDVGSVPDQGRSHKQWSNKTRVQLLSLCSRARALKEVTTMRRNLCTATRPMDCSPPGSSVHEILQARILEWVAISLSWGISDPGIEPKSLMSPASAGVFFTISATWQPYHRVTDNHFCRVSGSVAPGL